MQCRVNEFDGGGVGNEETKGKWGRGESLATKK